MGMQTDIELSDYPGLQPVKKTRQVWLDSDSKYFKGLVKLSGLTIRISSNSPVVVCEKGLKFELIVGLIVQFKN